MDSQAATKKIRKNPSKKENSDPSKNSSKIGAIIQSKARKKEQNTQSTNPYSNLNNIKSIKIPEKFEEKEKLLSSLKTNIGDIDLNIKNLLSRKEYYNELVGVLERELQEKRERQLLLRNVNSDVDAFQQELYSRNFYLFSIALYE
jgi:hypothetical protein